MAQVKEILKQYGCFGFVKRLLKFVLRHIGINYESYYFLSKNLSEISVVENDNRTICIRELSESDFLNSYNTSNFLDCNDIKIKLIKKRFYKGGYKAYGAFCKNDLIYACWLSINELEIPGYGILPTRENDCFFLDDYCAVHMRNKGIHKLVNQKRIIEARNLNKDHASIVILKENIPALKTQINSGFTILFTFYSFKLFRWNKTDFALKYYNS